MEAKKILLEQLDKIHTTALGMDRIKKNLKLDRTDVTEYCKALILKEQCKVDKRGKNFYCETDSIRLTIHSGSFTIITAHRIK